MRHQDEARGGEQRSNESSIKALLGAGACIQLSLPRPWRHFAAMNLVPAGGRGWWRGLTIELRPGRQRSMPQRRETCEGVER